MRELKEYFLLDPAVIFLNHGSFGATPKPVFETYQNWQRRLEAQPVLFLGREFDELLCESRKKLGEYVHADYEDLVYIPNATFGVNIIARSLKLQEGDEILTTNHEYGACDYTWNFNCKNTGARYIHQQISIPALSEDEIMEQFFEGLTEKTKVIYLSHISSPTALRFPIEKICDRARQLGILTVIDGAHALGQVDLDFRTLNADFYTSNCHKWSMAPKGAAFLYAHKRVQHLVEPLIVSWGFGNDPNFGTGSRFIDILQWTGTNDPAAYLSVPAAIKFMQDMHWGKIRVDCHKLLTNCLLRISELTKLETAYPLDSNLFIQVGIAPLPNNVDILFLKKRLYDEFKVEVPLTQLGEKKFVRVSVQGYNTQDDIDQLLLALKTLLPTSIKQ